MWPQDTPGRPAPVPRYPAAQGHPRRGDQATSQRWREGRCVLPVGCTLLTLTTPLEGKATGQPASGWRVPRVFLQPVSGTREPGGRDGGRMGLGARASCLLEVGCTHSGSHVLPARPKHQAWSRVEVQVERGLRSPRVQVLVTLQQISVSSSWCLRSIPTGPPRPSPPGNEKSWRLDRRPGVNLGLTSRSPSSSSAAWVGFPQHRARRGLREQSRV